MDIRHDLNLDGHVGIHDQTPINSWPQTFVNICEGGICIRGVVFHIAYKINIIDRSLGPLYMCEGCIEQLTVCRLCIDELDMVQRGCLEFCIEEGCVGEIHTFPHTFRVFRSTPNTSLRRTVDEAYPSELGGSNLEKVEIARTKLGVYKLAV